MPSNLKEKNTNHHGGKDNTLDLYIHDDLFYMNKNKKRDRYKIYLYDNFIF